MKTYTQQRLGVRSESGVVSILTVIFFMIFVSILTIGFIKIVNDDQIQATDSDLSASALTAAQSGVEDGKRLLLFCRTQATTPQLRTACDNALSGTQCDSVTGQASLMTALDIDLDANGDGIVSANPEYLQRYTCMNIQTVTDSIEGIQVEKGTSEIIPLLPASPTFNEITFSWHATATDRDGPVNAANLRTGQLLPAENQWNGAPAAVGLQLVAYRKTGIDLSTFQQDTRSLFLLPGRDAAPSLQTINLNAFDVRDADPNSATEMRPQLARCTSGTTSEYACTMTLRDLPYNPAVYNYYLRVSSLYAPTYIKVGLSLNGNPIQIDGIQPMIDVTGRANDVFRRVQTRVQFDSSVFLPQFALETGDICKNMFVTDSSITSSDLCNPQILGGNPTVCTPGPRDIVMIMDASHSMLNTWTTGTRLQNQANVAGQFVNGVSLSATGNKLAIVKFNDIAYKLQSLTTNKSGLSDAVNQTTPLLSRTAYLAALQASDEYLSDSNSRSGAEKTIIFMSDGRANDNGETTTTERQNTRNAVMNRVNQLRSKYPGFNMYTIAITLSTADSALLRDIVSGNGRFFAANEELQLNAAIQAILTDVSC